MNCVRAHRAVPVAAAALRLSGRRPPFVGRGFLYPDDYVTVLSAGIPKRSERAGESLTTVRSKTRGRPQCLRSADYPEFSITPLR